MTDHERETHGYNIQHPSVKPQRQQIRKGGEKRGEGGSRGPRWSCFLCPGTSLALINHTTTHCQEMVLQHTASAWPNVSESTGNQTCSHCLGMDRTSCIPLGM